MVNICWEKMLFYSVFFEIKSYISFQSISAVNGNKDKNQDIKEIVQLYIEWPNFEQQL